MIVNSGPWILVLIFFCIFSRQIRGMGQTPEGWWHESKALELNNSNFDNFVGKDQYVVVDFYAQWCVYCYQMVEEYNLVYEAYNGEKAARNDVLIAKIDGDLFSGISNKYHVHNFPTIIFFYPEHKQKPIHFNGPRVFHHFDSWIKNNAQPILQLNASSNVRKEETKPEPILNENQAKLNESIANATFKAEELKLKPLANETKKTIASEPQVVVIEGEEGEDTVLIISEKGDEEFDIELTQENTQYVQKNENKKNNEETTEKKENPKEEKKENQAKDSETETDEDDLKKNEENFLIGALEQLDESLEKGLEKLSQNVQSQVDDSAKYHIVSIFEFDSKLKVLEENLSTLSEFVSDLSEAMERQSGAFLAAGEILKQEIEREKEKGKRDVAKKKGEFLWLRAMSLVLIGSIFGWIGAHFYVRYKGMARTLAKDPIHTA